MRRLLELWRRLGATIGWRRDPRDRDLEEELRLHLQLAAEDAVRRGETARSAVVGAGSVPQTMESLRDQRGLPGLFDLTRDLRYGVRGMARNPGLTAIAILILALGIGISTSVAAIVDAVLVRPLPYSDPESLALVWQARGSDAAAEHGILTGEHVSALRGATDVFDDVGIAKLWAHNTDARVDVQSDGNIERLRGSLATRNFFDVLGVSADAGRTFARDDPQDVVILSHNFWVERYGADPEVVGRTIELLPGRTAAPESYTVIGVLPEGVRFTYPEETQIWVPLAEPVAPTPAIQYVGAGRLRAGFTVAAVEPRITEIMRDVIRNRPVPASLPPGLRSEDVLAGRENAIAWTASHVEPIGEHLTHDVGEGVGLLAIAGGALMFIACVNAALLVLAQTVRRSREIGVRSALGGGTWRVIRPLLVEIVLTSACGSAIGILLAALSKSVVIGLMPQAVPRADEIAIDLRVLLFAVASGTAVAFFCGLTALRYAARPNLAAFLGRNSEQTTGDTAMVRFRQVIVVAQVAVVVVCLAGSGLLVHSFWRLRNVDPGFDPDGLIAVETRLLNPVYFEPERVRQFEEAVLAEVRRIPEVEAASMTTSVPFDGSDSVIAGGSYLRSVDPAYFDLMSIPLRSGRLFTPADTPSAEPVMIVSESLARREFGNEDPIGKTIAIDGPVQIVGVVGDVRTVMLSEEPGPAIYRPRSQFPREWIVLVIRPRPGAANLLESIQAAIQSVDPEQPVLALTPLERIVDRHLENEKFFTVATLAFGIAALLISMAGLAGIVARVVAERRRELAVRCVFGARPSQIVGVVVVQGMQWVVVGLAVGLMIAIPSVRLLDHLLFQITPLDPMTYFAAVALILSLAAIACYVPARRAVRLDPMAALGCE